MKNKRKHIFLSPHLDDVILSCGGLMLQLIKANEKVQTVTVFSGIPDAIDKPSPLISHIHSLYENLNDIVQVRRIEDKSAVELLGADFLHLNFLDCIYRTDEINNYYVLTEADIFGNLKQPDQNLPEKIVAQIEALYSPTDIQLYAPLGIGSHIDHTITRLVALLLNKKGFSLVLYEDYPYSENNMNSEKAYTTLAGIRYQKKNISLSEQDLNQKINAIASYRSQLRMLFDAPEFMPSRVKRHSLEKGENYLMIE